MEESKILEEWAGSKFRIEVQNLTFEGCFEVRMILKIVWRFPPLFRLNLHTKNNYFGLISMKIEEKI